MLNTAKHPLQFFNSVERLWGLKNNPYVLTNKREDLTCFLQKNKRYKVHTCSVFSVSAHVFCTHDFQLTHPSPLQWAYHVYSIPKKANGKEVLYRHRIDSKAKHWKTFKTYQVFWLELMTFLIKPLFAQYNFTYTVKPTYVLCILAWLTQENSQPHQIITDTKTFQFFCRILVLVIHSEGCKHYI